MSVFDLGRSRFFGMLVVEDPSLPPGRVDLVCPETGSCVRIEGLSTCAG